VHWIDGDRQADDTNDCPKEQEHTGEYRTSSVSIHSSIFSPMAACSSPGSAAVSTWLNAGVPPTQVAE
jgi:hypothetical protein